MTLKKYVVLVDQKGGPLCQVAARLEQLDYRVITVPEARDAIELVLAFPKLSAVVVNETLCPDSSRELLQALRNHQPRIPVLWHGETEDLLLADSQPIVLSDVPGAEEVGEYCEGAMTLDDYTSSAVSWLTRASLQSLAGFGLHCCTHEGFAKVSRTRLAELNALVQWTGLESSGALVVGCAREAANSAYCRMFGQNERPTDAHLGDMLGELANRITGRILEYSGLRGSPSIGLPLLISGANSCIWQDCDRSSVGLEFEGLSGRFFVEFCGNLEVENGGSEEFPRDVLEAGQLIVL